jgi:UDP-N-acetylmuramoylalanine--D-glutamate ligase
MTTTLIYEILKANEKYLNAQVHIGGNIRGVATLPLLKKAKPGDILVCELDSWQLQGFGDAKLSPHISVFTSFMPDHMNYYKNDFIKYFNDKANIFKYQKSGDTLIVRPSMKDFINKTDTVGNLVVINKKEVATWKFIVPGDNQRENMACAVEVAKQFNIPINSIKKIVESFKGVEGRLQYMKSVKGVKIYNDNNATTPEATISGLQALASTDKNIILVCGGADKNLDLNAFNKSINKYCKFVSFIPGTGTEKFLSTHKVKVQYEVGKDLKSVVVNALKQSKKGDIILFSPAFASFGMFNNEYDRNDQFVKIVNKLDGK